MFTFKACLDWIRSFNMNLTATIQAHFLMSPPHLQREALHCIGYLEQRYRLESTTTTRMTTGQFITRFAGCLSADFLDDIDTSDLASDVAMAWLE